MLSIVTQRSLKYLVRSVISVRRTLKVPVKKTNAYFGYGANIDPDYFNELGLAFDTRGAGVLKDHKLEFTMPCEYHGVGYGSVTPSKGDQVWGTVYQLDNWSMFYLDLVEWVPFGAYKRLKKPVKMKDGQYLNDANVYVASFPRSGLKPPSEYMSWVIESSKKVGFPSEYLNYLHSIQGTDKFELDHQFNLIRQGSGRVFPNSMRPIYEIHDRLREKLAEMLP